MSNINDNETLEMIYEDVLADDDREQILEFIAESIFYKQFT